MKYKASRRNIKILQGMGYNVEEIAQKLKLSVEDVKMVI